VADETHAARKLTNATEPYLAVYERAFLDLGADALNAPGLCATLSAAPRKPTWPAR